MNTVSTLPLSNASLNQCELAADPSRQANATILGYVYQIWCSIDAWLQMSSPDEIIFLEGAEDIDKVTPSEATTEQVKHEAAPLSLNNKRAHQALENFWILSERETSRRVNFHYITTATASTEQDTPFSGMCGLELWRVAQTSIQHAEVIRTYLAPKLAATSPLRKFLETATPEQVQERLICRFRWLLNQPGLEEVKQSVDDRVVYILEDKNLPLYHVEKVRNHLHAFACNVITRPESSKRRLSKADLLRQIDAATTQYVAVSAQYYQQFSRAIQSGGFDSGSEYLRLMRLPLPATPEPLLSRTRLVAQTRLLIEERKTVLLNGSVFKGKTTVALLVANTLCPDAWWYPIPMRSGTETDNLIRALAAVVSDESTPPLIVIDDLDLSPRAHAAYRQSLALLVNRANRAGRGLLLTARGTSSDLAQLSEFTGIEAIDVQGMSIEEVQEHCIDNGCQNKLSLAWSTFICALTMGHPKLVQVRIAELRAKDWPAPDLKNFSPSPAINTARQVARQLLSESMSQEAAAFVYTAAEANYPMTRQMLLVLAQFVGGITNAGDLIDRLQGNWFERVTAERISVTPMLKGSATDVWPVQRKQLAHCHIYDAIAGSINLNEGDAASLLYQAYMSQDGSRLAHCALQLETIKDSTVLSVVLQQLAWLPYAALEAGQRIFQSQPAVSILLRQLQFSVANELDSDSLPKIIDRWTEELNLIPEKGLCELLEAMRCAKLLFNNNPRVPLRTKMRAIAVLGKATGEAGRITEEIVQHTIKMFGELPGEIPDSPMSTQLFFSLQASSVRRLEDLASVIDWLEQDADEASRRAFEETLHWPLVTAVGAFVHGAWASRHTTEGDWSPTIELLRRARAVAQHLGLAQFGSEAARAESIVHGEHLHDHESAMRVLEDAAAAFGETMTIQEQRVNALFQANNDAGALDAWKVLISVPEAISLIDAFAYRRAAISACRLKRWPLAEGYFLEGSTRANNLTLPLTKLGLIVDASYVVALAGEPMRAARMLSEVLLDLPPQIWEEGDENWEAFCRIVSTTSNFIQAVADGSDTSKVTLAFGKASEPGISFGAAQPNQALRAQLTIAQVGLIASQLGDVPNEYGTLLTEAANSNFPCVRFVAAQAKLAAEFNATPSEKFVEKIASFELIVNSMASLPDRSLLMQSDGGYTKPTTTQLNESGWLSVFTAAVVCSVRPEDVLGSWQNDAIKTWGNNSQIAKDLTEVRLGLELSLELAEKTLFGDGEISNGIRIGAAISLLKRESQNPIKVLRLQEFLAFATIHSTEGLLLKPTFERAIARHFAAFWKEFAANFSPSMKSIQELKSAITAVEQGMASIRLLMEKAAKASGGIVGGAISRFE